MSTLTLAQFSDCHLYADDDALHLGANVYQNLVQVLTDIKGFGDVDVVVFSGDLSQDHSEQSYQLFAQAWQQSQLTVPLLYLPGNHDCPELLQRYVSQLSPVDNSTAFQLQPYRHQSGKQAQVLTTEHWQLVLMDSQSDSPAGFFPTEQYCQLSGDLSPAKQQLLFIHHHPVDVGYFIDKHGLINQSEFWLAVNRSNNIQAIACGHIHRGLHLKAANKVFSGPSDNGKGIDLYTCPATSIQFDTDPEELKATAAGPGYRLFKLSADGGIDSRTVMLAAGE